MRPSSLITKVFLDSGDPAQTKEALNLLSFLDGQTTNPSLVAKHPAAVARLAEGKKFSRDEIYGFYRGIVTEISQLIPQGSVSVEVYADTTTTAAEMIAQGSEMFTWIPNAHIKLPTTAAGLEAAEALTSRGIRVNMTLCFSEAQAAAVYAATKGAKPGHVFISPFIGRLDDRGENGLQLIENIVRLYKQGDGHVQVLAASIRSDAHLVGSIMAGAGIITVPLAMLRAWHDAGMPLTMVPAHNNLAPLPYQELSLDKPWQSYDIDHPLTTQGIERFVQDWNALLA